MQPVTAEPHTLRALVAEDEPAMLNLNAGFLRQKGFAVTEASDGEKAWALAGGGNFDLVLLDVMMPGMSGWEVCKRIKGSAETRGTAVIMLTGIGETLNDATSPLFAADAWLNKPYDFTELERKLRETLGRYGKVMPDGASSFYETNDEPPPSMPFENLGPSIHKAAPKKAAPKKAAPKKAAKKALARKAPPKSKLAKTLAKKAARKASKKAAVVKKAAPAKTAKPGTAKGLARRRPPMKRPQKRGAKHP